MLVKKEQGRGVKETFVKNEKNGLVYFTVPAFARTGLVLHAFSGRTGGVSEGAYESLNLSILTDDKLENVWENRRRMVDVLGVEAGAIVGAHQVHKDKVYRVLARDKGLGAFDPDTVIPATDALTTNEPGILLMAFFADCVPLFFLDPVRKAVAVAHAGWKGTVAGIAAKTVNVMKEEYGTHPQDLLAAVGPSIGPCHYQVDAPVIAEFKKRHPLNWEAFFSNLTKDGYGQLNLWEANLWQLLAAGLRKENVTVASLCTYCRPECFFSHRRGMAGRHAAMIMLKEG